MQNFKKSLVALAGVLLLASAVALVTPRVSRGQMPELVGPTRPVEVVNAPSNPVPVTGTITVGNPGGEPLPVRDVDHPARQPFQAVGNCRTTVTFDCSTNIYTVPAGKRLVIEYASMQMSTSTGSSSSATFAISTNVGGTVTSHRLPIGAPAQFHFGFLTVVSQQVRLYADPGTVVSVGGLRDLSGGSSGQYSFDFSISGHLVDVP